MNMAATGIGTGGNTFNKSERKIEMVALDVEYLSTLYDLPQAEKVVSCRRDIVLALDSHSPTALRASDAMDMFQRYFRHSRTNKLYEQFHLFLQFMEMDSLIIVQHLEDLPVAVQLRHSRETKSLLRLPPCMQRVRVCHDAGCRHRFDCDVYRTTLQAKASPREHRPASIHSRRS